MGLATESVPGSGMMAVLVQLMEMLAVPAFTILGYMLIDELKTRGYSTRYTNALVRAVGAAADAANDRGTTLFTPQGRAIGLAAGIKYLNTTVGGPSQKLGIDDEGHALRINAQIGVPLATANPPLEKPVEEPQNEKLLPVPAAAVDVGKPGSMPSPLVGNR